MLKTRLIISNFRYFAYAQGMPLIVSLITACADNIGSVPDLQKPNMGEYGCFLGYSANSEKPSFSQFSKFFASSYFLYLYLYLMLILIANTVFLVLTLIKLREGFKTIEDDIKSQGR